MLASRQRPSHHGSAITWSEYEGSAWRAGKQHQAGAPHAAAAKWRCAAPLAVCGRVHPTRRAHIFGREAQRVGARRRRWRVAHAPCDGVLVLPSSRAVARARGAYVAPVCCVQLADRMKHRSRVSLSRTTLAWLVSQHFDKAKITNSAPPAAHIQIGFTRRKHTPRRARAPSPPSRVHSPRLTSRSTSTQHTHTDTRMHFVSPRASCRLPPRGLDSRPLVSLLGRSRSAHTRFPPLRTISRHMAAHACSTRGEP